MANNNQLSYQTATIDPTIAGYAAKDPGFALGLLLGRGWVENYNERGIRKLQDSLKGKDGLTPGGESAQPSEQSQTNSEAASTDNAKQVPQIFSANQSPTMQTVNPYQPQAVNASQPMTDTQKAVMENAVANASTPQAGDTGYKDALMARVRNILYDPNNQWAQSAARGAIYNKLKEMGDPGGGNPYAMGNYIDPSKNFSQQALAQSFANKWTPQTVMNADGTVTQNPAPGYVANNPLQGASMYAIQGNANQGIQSPDMNAQFRAYLNGETPQTAPVLDAVQAAQAQQAVADNTQNVIPPQAKTANFTDAEQDEKSDEPVQQEQTSQEEKPVVSKLETTATEQNSQNGKTVQSALQNNVQPTPLKPFSVKDWIAQVTQAGIAQGRPMNQIQAVISRGLPAAQAAEDNYKKQAVDGLLNRIYNGDETTGGKSLLPTMENANTTVPKLMQTLNEIDSIDPERGTQIRAILPSYNTFLKENISNFNKARDVGYSMKLSDHSMENNIKQHERLGQFDDERTKNMAKWKHAMSVAWRNQDLADRANLISKYSNGQITPDQAMGMLLGLGGKGSGVASGDVQKTSKGTLVINGNELSKAQTVRSNELDANLRRMSDELKGYMANSTADDVKNGTSSNGKNNKDNLARSINALNAYISGLDDKDRALIPNSIWDGLQQQLYAANFIRENLAGNGKMKNAIEYLKALTPETRQKYNIVT
nr:MAG TPA: hypothetical protein [Caudoviricetes sp.]